MALAMKPVADGSNFTSNNLWVGSLTTDTTESDLTELFGRYGDIDRITAYSSRSFAFIYFRRLEEAVAAKEALQGANLNGSQIKIEYARPIPRIGHVSVEDLVRLDATVRQIVLLSGYSPDQKRNIDDRLMVKGDVFRRPLHS